MPKKPLTSENPINTIDESEMFDRQSAFDEELAFLSSIQTRFLSLHNQVPAEHDDPDVKRLTEAMAAFMAKGRLAGKQQIDQLHLRVFQQLLPYLSSPVPSMALLRANTRYITEACDIKPGCVFTLSSDEGEQAQYRSVYGLPLRPIAIERAGYKVDSSVVGAGNNQLLIDLKAHTPVPGQLDHLPLYLTVNNNFPMSLLLKQVLQQQLVHVCALFDGHTTVQGRFTVGACLSESVQQAPDEPTRDLHPVESVRRYFQLPQQENYLNLYFHSAPQQWQRCELTLTLKGHWPQQLKLSSDLFQLDVICVENVVQEQAETITFDATQSAHAIRPPSTAADLCLLNCLGVYKGTAKNREALRPGILKSGDAAYDIHDQSKNNLHANAQGKSQWSIDIQLASAFKKPEKITIDALWHQPEFSKHLWQKLKARTRHLDIPGLNWRVFSPPVAHIPSSEDDAQSLLELSLLKNKGVLSLDDIVFILESLSSVFHREFKNVKALLKSVRVGHEKPKGNDLGFSSQAFRAYSNYQFSLYDFPPALTPLLNAFFSRLEALLNVWIANTDIQVSLQTNSLAQDGVSISNTINEEIVDAYNQTTDGGKTDDYRLIPPCPERLFIIGDDDGNDYLLEHGGYYE